MADSMYSVTLTGKILPGRDAPRVWERVAQLLKLDATTFRERLLSRLPVTLKAVSYEDARRQQEALTSSGADVRLFPEEAHPRLWVRLDQTTRGPLSMAYARHALHEADLGVEVKACLQGGKQWQSLAELVRAHAPPASDAAVPAPPDRVPATSPAAALRVRRGLPGWGIALIVVGVSMALIGALATIVAVPLYQDHVIRAQVAQGARMAERPKTAVDRYLSENGRLPKDNAEAGLAESSSILGPYVDSVTVDHGDVTVHFSERAASRVRDRRLQFSPMTRHGKTVWTCLSPDLAYRYLPPGCR